MLCCFGWIFTANISRIQVYEKNFDNLDLGGGAFVVGCAPTVCFGRHFPGNGKVRVRAI